MVDLASGRRGVGRGFIACERAENRSVIWLNFSSSAPFRKIAKKLRFYGRSPVLETKYLEFEWFVSKTGLPS